MNRESATPKVIYIATPRTHERPERIDEVLARRMQSFLLERRRKVWQQEGR